MKHNGFIPRENLLKGNKKVNKRSKKRKLPKSNLFEKIIDVSFMIKELIFNIMKTCCYLGTIMIILIIVNEMITKGAIYSFLPLLIKLIK